MAALNAGFHAAFVLGAFFVVLAAVLGATLLRLPRPALNRTLVCRMAPRRKYATQAERPTPGLEKGRSPGLRSADRGHVGAALRCRVSRSV